MYQKSQDQRDFNTSPPLYNVNEIINLFPNTEKYINNRYALRISSVSIDTRTIEKGSLFFAINKGIDFVEIAIKKGSALVICDKMPDFRNQNIFSTSNIIIVPDVIEALAQVAMYNRSKIKAKIIGITGNIGKTTIKEIINTVLKSFFKVQASQKSYNNHIGLPYTLANVRSETEVVILEMGMNHKGEIEHLSKIAKPDIAIITTIAPVHTEFFNNIEEIALAKSEIFSGMNENGIVILNQENKYYDIILQEAKRYKIKNIINIGSEKSHLFVKDYKFNNKFQTEYKFVVKKKEGEEVRDAVVTGLSYHSCFNTLFIIAIAILLKLPLNKVIDTIASLEIFEGRGNIRRINMSKKEILLINDSYNASPEAMKSAINSLGVLKEMHPNWEAVLIIGDMLELGKDSTEYHMSLADLIIKNNIDTLITVGPFTKKLAESLIGKVKNITSFDETRELVKNVRKIIKHQQIVLLKASNSFNFNVVAEKLSS